MTSSSGSFFKVKPEGMRKTEKLRWYYDNIKMDLNSVNAKPIPETTPYKIAKAILYKNADWQKKFIENVKLER
jgi:hypothetical protein